MRIRSCLAFLFFVLSCTMLLGSAASAAPLSMKPVQMYDVKAGKVVKSINNDEQFQQLAASMLDSVTGLAPQLAPEDKCGYVYRIPLNKQAVVKTGNLTLQTDDIFLFYCPDKPSVLLVFDAQRKPYLLSFTADLKPFLAKVGSPAS